MASSDSESSYEVDQILNQRKRKGVVEYLVRWRGFGKEEDSWEPLKNLANCAAAMAAYVKLTAPSKTQKKSTKSRSRSRSRSTSRSRTTKTKSSRSRTPRARSRTPRSRSRSSSRGRQAKQPETPPRQSRRTEVVTKSSTNRTPGRVERTTEVVKQIRDESKPTEVKTTRVVQSRTEVKTVEDKVDGKLVAAKPQEGTGTSLYTLWQTADTAVLILFVCVSIIVLSYVVENYCSPSAMWKFLVGLYTSVVGAVVAVWQCVTASTARALETAANFTRNSWKKVTTN
ncbi:chromo domain-containing protein cec-3-like [Haliotis rubra]|uniref:chromo domain-containing protein cec-3-like n=1 Tax=Haliotis rubra TaxID=36100 RepID=UPI001EE55F1A|nr:chromo domain-containing protein cec-3-like [Haliotis rubra]